ncbi:MAG TPA: hypothetical protein VF189_05960 [Patescibacteria group bacterium]
MKWYWKVVFIFVIWRLFLFTPMFYSQSKIPTNPDSIQYTIWAYTRPYFPVISIFLYPLANFDGVHYLTIAGDGNYRDGADGRFFPLYPYLIRIPYVILGSGPFMGLKEFSLAFIITNGIFLGALLAFYKLIRLDYSENVAITTLILLLAFPTSFFFGSFYSEGTFLLLSILTFYFIRKKDYSKASWVTLLLSLSRIVGVCMIPITSYFYIKENYSKFLTISKLSKRQKWQLLKPLIIMPIGIIFIVIYCFFRWHDALYFVHAQQLAVNGRKLGEIIFFPQTIVRYIRILFTVPYTQYAWWISLLEFSSFFFGAIGLWYAWKKGISKSYIIFSGLMFLISTQTGTFNGLPRYVIVLFPVFMALSLNKSWILKGLYILIGVISLFFLLVFFSKGYFVS